jgi:hypothetical protein
VNVKKYQQAFLALLPGNGCYIAFEPTSSSYLYKKIISFVFFLPISSTPLPNSSSYFCFSLPLPSAPLPIKVYPCPYLSTIQGEFLEPQPSSGFELHPGYISLVREQPFSGAKNEDPHDHLWGFKKLCSCLVIPGIP